MNILALLKLPRVPCRLSGVTQALINIWAHRMNHISMCPTSPPLQSRPNLSLHNVRHTQKEPFVTKRCSLRNSNNRNTLHVYFLKVLYFVLLRFVQLHCNVDVLWRSCCILLCLVAKHKTNKTYRMKAELHAGRKKQRRYMQSTSTEKVWMFKELLSNKPT